MTFLKKSTCSPPHQFVNTPSPAALRRSTGAPNGRADKKAGNAADTTPEAFEAGRARKKRAHPVDFVSTLFEIEKNMKRYVGGLVHSMDQLNAYRASSLRAMI